MGVREIGRSLEQFGVKDVQRRVILAPTPPERERWYAILLLTQGGRRQPRGVDGPGLPHLGWRTSTILGPRPTTPRSLAGKPLAGFRATPSRRIPVLYGMVMYIIRVKNPLLHRQSTLRKRNGLGRIGVPGQTSRPTASTNGSTRRCRMILQPAPSQEALPWPGGTAGGPGRLAREVQ